MDDNKKFLYSGIQPSSCITIGNYIGAIDSWIKMQDEFNCIFSIADLHSLTVRQVPSELRQRTVSLYAQYLACGLDPEKSIVYIQSHVPEHTQLSWILNNYTYVGEMERMTQFKDKSARHQNNINMGLMDYPVLMAADILLFNTDVVPVGIDQKQHVEFARDVAMRFNNIYGEVFTIPEPVIRNNGAKIYSLQEPTVKMSKSDPNPNAAVSILDDKDTIIRKFKRAVTDSGSEIKFSEEKAGVSNLLTIYSAYKNITIAEAEEHFIGKGYGDFKMEVAESVIEKLEPVQVKYAEYMKNKDYLSQLAHEGADKAQRIAFKTIRKVYKKVGLFN